MAFIPSKNKKELALKIEKALPLKSTQDFFNSIGTLNNHVLSIIEERRKLNLQENFLDTIMEAKDSDDQKEMSNQQLLDEVVTLLIAGHETTANALTWTWHLLLRHPEIFAKVKEEIASVVTGDTPTFEELSKLFYTEAVFAEALRLYPPFWRVARKNTQATKIKGYDIPANTNIGLSIYTIHRKKELWEDANQFKPERFLNKKHLHRFAYIPFGAGPRSCIGAQFANIEALTVLALCIKKCNFELISKAEPEYLTNITLQPKNGCKVRVQ